MAFAATFVIGLVAVLLVGGFWAAVFRAFRREPITLLGAANWYVQTAAVLSVALVAAGLIAVIAAIMGFMNSAWVYSQPTALFPGGNGLSPATFPNSGDQTREIDLIMGLVLVALGVVLAWFHRRLGASIGTAVEDRLVAWATPLLTLFYVALFAIGSFISFLGVIVNNGVTGATDPWGYGLAASIVLLPLWAFMLVRALRAVRGPVVEAAPVV